MYRSTTQSSLAALLAVCMLLVAGLSYAEEDDIPQEQLLRAEPTAGLPQEQLPRAEPTAGLPQEQLPREEPTAEAILFDLVVLRPLGLAATALGVVAFVVALPFTLPTKSTKEVGQKLVADPVKYTFVRPLGHLE